MKTTKYFFLTTLLAAITLITNPLLARALTVSITWQQPPTSCGCNPAGYRIYDHETGALLCQVDDPTATTISCSLGDQQDIQSVDMTLFCEDGSESYHSRPKSLDSSLPRQQEIETGETWLTDPPREPYLVNDSPALDETESQTDQGPTPSFTSHALVGQEQGTLLFEALESQSSQEANGLSPAVQYLWDFGDGTRGTGMTMQHTFDAAGTYLVTLTLIDNDGQQTTVTRRITVAKSRKNYTFLLSVYHILLTGK